MKITEFKKLIKEEVRKVLAEDNLDSPPKSIQLTDKNNKAITISLFYSDTMLLYRNMNHNNDKAELIVNNVTPKDIINQFIKLGVVEKLNNKYILADKYTNYKMIDLAKMLKNVTLNLKYSK